jgi:hypothetical protein
VGSGESALIYLGRYLYRGVIQENDMWLVLQHVLPKGFRRARNFGFLHPNCKHVIALLHVLLKCVPGQTLAWVKQRAPILCTCCGAVMAIVRTRIPSPFTGQLPISIAAEGNP